MVDPHQVLLQVLHPPVTMVEDSSEVLVAVLPVHLLLPAPQEVQEDSASIKPLLP